VLVHSGHYLFTGPNQSTTVYLVRGCEGGRWEGKGVDTRLQQHPDQELLWDSSFFSFWVEKRIETVHRRGEVVGISSVNLESLLALLISPKFLVGSRLSERILWLFKISIKGEVLWHIDDYPLSVECWFGLFFLVHCFVIKWTMIFKEMVKLNTKSFPWLRKVLLMDILLEVSWSKLAGCETHKEGETHN